MNTERGVTPCWDSTTVARLDQGAGLTCRCARWTARQETEDRRQGRVQVDVTTVKMVTMSFCPLFQVTTKMLPKHKVLHSIGRQVASLQSGRASVQACQRCSLSLAAASMPEPSPAAWIRSRGERNAQKGQKRASEGERSTAIKVKRGEMATHEQVMRCTYLEWGASDAGAVADICRRKRRAKRR